MRICDESPDAVSGRGSALIPQKSGNTLRPAFRNYVASLKGEDALAMVQSIQSMRNHNDSWTWRDLPQPCEYRALALDMEVSRVFRTFGLG